MTYKARLEIVMGGKLTAGIKKLSATAKGAKYSYGIETKIRVEKTGIQILGTMNTIFLSHGEHHLKWAVRKIILLELTQCF